MDKSVDPRLFKAFDIESRYRTTQYPWILSSDTPVPGSESLFHRLRPMNHFTLTKDNSRWHVCLCHYLTDNNPDDDTIGVRSNKGIQRSPFRFHTTRKKEERSIQMRCSIVASLKLRPLSSYVLDMHILPDKSQESLPPLTNI